MRHILRHISTNWNPDTLQAKFIYEYLGDIYETDYFICIDENTLVNGWTEFSRAFLNDNEGINTIPDEDLQSPKFEKWNKPAKSNQMKIICEYENFFTYNHAGKFCFSDEYPPAVIKKLNRAIVENSFNEY